MKKQSALPEAVVCVVEMYVLLGWLQEIAHGGHNPHYVPASPGRAPCEACWSCALHVLTWGRTDLLGNHNACPQGLPPFSGLSIQMRNIAGSRLWNYSPKPFWTPSSPQGTFLLLHMPVTIYGPGHSSALCRLSPFTCTLPSLLDSLFCERKTIHWASQSSI